MAIGMYIHRLAAPRPNAPSFFINITSSISARRGTIKLAFYVPSGYQRPFHGRGKGSSITNGTSLYPVVINFHGGGFTMGSHTDDARWASTVNANVDAVVVSVGYRLAPEYPFPTAVQDGVDAVLWIQDHGHSLGLDCGKLGFSGFSSGGNLCFGVALMLGEELKRMNETVSKVSNVVTTKPCILVSWYPSVDYTLSREERRASNPGGAGKSLSKSLTSLFDASYIYPRETVANDNPYLSPATAQDDALICSLPEDIMIITCEWDQLLVEGEAFRQRLKKLGKRVTGRMVPEVKHGWNLMPNPFEADPKAEMVYQDACAELMRVFNSR